MALKKLRVLTIVGTRPELIKLSEVIKELDRQMDHTLVHTGQNYDYELNGIFFEQLGVREPDYFLNVAKPTPGATISEIISKSEKIFSELKPDAILVYGDTNSCLCVISAKRLKIPIFHMEAGNRSFDQRVPEEINRKIVDHLSDINITLSDHARRNLEAEGIKSESIIKVGSCMKEVLDTHMQSINSSNILDDLELDPKSYFIMSLHREETVDNERVLEMIIKCMVKIIDEHRRKIIFTTHPRTRKRLDSLSLTGLPDELIFAKPFGFFDYINLQRHAYCVISDSGTIAEEGSLLGVPCVTIREAHERPEAMDATTFLMCDPNPDRVLNAINIAVSHSSESNLGGIGKVNDYFSDNVSKKICRIILSYTDYVQRNTWKRHPS